MLRAGSTLTLRCRHRAQPLLRLTERTISELLTQLDGFVIVDNMNLFADGVMIATETVVVQKRNLLRDGVGSFNSVSE